MNAGILNRSSLGNYIILDAVSGIADLGAAIAQVIYLISDFFKGKKETQKGMFYFTLPAFHNANDIISLYLWNPGKQQLQYDNFKVAVYSNR